MEYKLIKQPTLSNNVFEPVKNAGQRVDLTRVTSEALYAGSTITSLNVSSTAFDMKSGDKINIGGQSLTLSADAAATATSFSVTSTVLEHNIDLHAIIDVDTENLFVQYQRKTEGTIGGLV